MQEIGHGYISKVPNKLKELHSEGYVPGKW